MIPAADTAKRPANIPVLASSFVLGDFTLLPPEVPFAPLPLLLVPVFLFPCPLPDGFAGGFGLSLPLSPGVVGVVGVVPGLCGSSGSLGFSGSFGSSGSSGFSAGFFSSADMAFFSSSTCSSICSCVAFSSAYTPSAAIMAFCRFP